MQKIILFLSISAITISCSNPVTDKINEVKETVSNATSLAKEATNMESDINDLTATLPKTNAELKAWLPEEINGMKRISYKAGAMGMMKMASIEATFANEDKSEKIKVELIDGAGEMGAMATTGMRLLFTQDFEEEDEYKIKRTVEKDGYKVIEEYQKDNSKTVYMFLEGKRFFITVTGSGLDKEATWNACKQLKTSDLK